MKAKKEGTVYIKAVDKSGATLGSHIYKYTIVAKPAISGTITGSASANSVSLSDYLVTGKGSTTKWTDAAVSKWEIKSKVATLSGDGTSDVVTLSGKNGKIKVTAYIGGTDKNALKIKGTIKVSGF